MTFHNDKIFTFIFLIFSGEHLSMEIHQNHEQLSSNSKMDPTFSAQKTNNKSYESQISYENTIIREMIKKQQTKVEINLNSQFAYKHNLFLMAEKLYCQGNQQNFSMSPQPVFFPHQGQPMVFPTHCTLGGCKPAYQQSQSHTGYNFTEYYYPLLWPGHSIDNLFNNQPHESINKMPVHKQFRWENDENLENSDPLPPIDQFKSQDRKAPRTSILKNKYTRRPIQLFTRSILKKKSKYADISVHEQIKFETSLSVPKGLRIFKITKDVSKIISKHKS